MCKRAAEAAVEANDRTDDYRSALWAAWALDETDALEGGVPPDAVADRLGVTNRAAGTRLAALVEAGYATRVRGANPTTGRPRPSYIPVDLAAAGEEVA